MIVTTAVPQWGEADFLGVVTIGDRLFWIAHVESRTEIRVAPVSRAEERRLRAWWWFNRQRRRLERLWWHWVLAPFWEQWDRQ